MENRNAHERDHALDDATSGQIGKECQTYPNSIPIIKKARTRAKRLRGKCRRVSVSHELKPHRRPFTQVVLFVSGHGSE